MIHRFLALGPAPELRTEPSAVEKGIQDLELLLTVEAFWEINEVILQLRYLRSSEQSTARQYSKLQKIIAPYIILERDRVWFAKNGLG